MFKKRRDKVISPCLGSPCSTREDDGYVQRSAVSSDDYIWPKTRDGNGKITVLVPYTVNNIAVDIRNYYLDSKALKILEEVKATFKKKTCIQLVPRSNQVGYIELYKGKDCSSAIGYRGKKQQLSIGTNCDYYGTMVHEFLHALGFYHEQSRSDRDNYVRIFRDNILDGYERQFDKRYDTRKFGIPYDFKSIMHYTKNEFSKNGKPTIVSIEDANMALGGQKLSAGDISRINVLYNCPQKDTAQADYEIKIFTKDSWGAGTDAKVYIDLYENNEKNTGEVHVKGGSFERGDVDTFKEALPYMRTLSKIDIRHDNTGWFADWDLEKVEVVIDHRGTKNKYTFNCNCDVKGDQNTKTLKPKK